MHSHPWRHRAQYINILIIGRNLFLHSLPRRIFGGRSLFKCKWAFENDNFDNNERWRYYHTHTAWTECSWCHHFVFPTSLLPTSLHPASPPRTSIKCSLIHQQQSFTIVMPSPLLNAAAAAPIHLLVSPRSHLSYANFNRSLSSIRSEHSRGLVFSLFTFFLWISIFFW